MDDRWFQAVHSEFTERSNEFKALHHDILKAAKRYRNYGTSVHVTIVILGAVSAAQATFKDQMGADRMGTVPLFTVLAILMTIAAGLESFFKWNKKSGALCSLAAMCAIFEYKWYDRRYKVESEYATQRNERNLHRMRKLAEDYFKARNSKIMEIQNRAAELGMADVTLTVQFVSPRGHVRVPLGHKKIDPSSDGDGRSVKGQTILNTPNGDRDPAGQERH